VAQAEKIHGVTVNCTAQEMPVNMAILSVGTLNHKWNTGKPIRKNIVTATRSRLCVYSSALCNRSGGTAVAIRSSVTSTSLRAVLSSRAVYLSPDKKVVADGVYSFFSGAGMCIRVHWDRDP
jgi:hypothetical protein